MAAASFVGTSIFALSGLLLIEPVGQRRRGAARHPRSPLLLDLLLAPFVLPLALRVFRRVQPRQVAY